MENIIEIDGHSVAVGLQWQSLRSETSEKKEASEIAKESNAEFGTLFVRDNITFLGIFPGAAPRGTICGAACLAAAAGERKEDFVLLEPAGDNLVWLCAVRNGAPLKGYDVVVSGAQAFNLIDELSQSIDGLNIYSRDGFVDGSMPGNFLDLVRSESENWISKAPRVVRLRGVSKILSLAIAIVVIGGLGTIGGMYYLDRASEAASALQEAATAQMKGAASASEIAKVEDDAKAAIATEFKQKLGGTPSYDIQISRWLTAIENVPSNLAGWDASTMVCSQDLCSITYRRQKVGTLEDFISSAADNSYPLGKVSGNEVEINLKIQGEGRSLPSSQLPSEKLALWPLLSQLQLLELAGLTFDVRESKKFSVMTAVIPNHPSVPVLSQWSMGEYSISGKQYFEIRDSSEYLVFSFISATSLKINLGTGSWVIGGSYATN